MLSLIRFLNSCQDDPTPPDGVNGCVKRHALKLDDIDLVRVRDACEELQMMCQHILIDRSHGYAVQ